MKKKFLFTLFLSMAVILLVASFARADDEEEGDDEEYSSSSPSSSSGSTTTKMVTQTIIVEPAKTVTSTVMKNVDLPDSDRDGIPDEQDMHPQIPQQFIIEDLNLDGIDDRLELEG
jgi:hypothetical protein